MRQILKPINSAHIGPVLEKCPGGTDVHSKENCYSGGSRRRKVPQCNKMSFSSPATGPVAAIDNVSISANVQCPLGGVQCNDDVLMAPISQHTPMESGDTRLYLVCTTIAVLCFTNSLYGDFVHDDIPAIVRNADVLGTTTVWQLFHNDFWGQPMSHPDSHQSYRPITTLTFR